MAVIIPFRQIVLSRRRRRQWAHLRECVEILEASLRLAEEQLDAAPAPERPVYARRVQQLGELRDYAARIL